MIKRFLGTLIGVALPLLLIGCSNTDLAKVAADREGYAGQTLQSMVVLVGISGDMYVLPLGVAPGSEQKLTVPEPLREKVLNVRMAVGQDGLVCIKYTVAKANAYPAALGELVDIWVP
jgi:hypothetical protein